MHFCKLSIDRFNWQSEEDTKKHNNHYDSNDENSHNYTIENLIKTLMICHCDEDDDEPYAVGTTYEMGKEKNYGIDGMVLIQLNHDNVKMTEFGNKDSIVINYKDIEWWNYVIAKEKLTIHTKDNKSIIIRLFDQSFYEDDCDC